MACAVAPVQPILSRLTLQVPLTLHVTHTCAGSMLQTAALVCTDAPPPAGETVEVDPTSSLGASLTVRSGGLPPGKPGRPYLQHLNSYGSLRVVWVPPEFEGDSPVSRYAWVEYVGGVPVLTGDAVQLAASGLLAAP